jgi:hypothetical protein
MELRTKKLLTTTSTGLFFLLGGIEYAVIIPTLYPYLKTFGGDETFYGVTFAAFIMSGLFSGPTFGLITDHVRKTKVIVLVANMFEIGGNFMYFAARSKYMVLGGRLISGVGVGAGASILAQVAWTTTEKERTAVFSFAMAMKYLGMMTGPALNILLEKIHFDMGSLEVNENTVPGLFMAAVWCIMQIMIIFMYYDLPSIHERSSSNENQDVGSERRNRVTTQSEFSMDDVTTHTEVSTDDESDREMWQSYASKSRSYGEVLSSHARTSQSDGEILNSHVITDEGIVDKQAVRSQSDGEMLNCLAITDGELLDGQAIKCQSDGEIMKSHAIKSQSDEMVKSLAIKSQSDAERVKSLAIRSLRPDGEKVNSRSHRSYSVDSEDSLNEIERSAGYAPNIQQSKRSNISWTTEYLREEIMVLFAFQFILNFNLCALESLVVPMTGKLFGWNQIPNSGFFSGAAILCISMFIGIRFLSKVIADRWILTIGLSLEVTAVCYLMVVIPDMEPHTHVARNEILFIFGCLMVILGLPCFMVGSTSLLSKLTSMNNQGKTQAIRRVIANLGEVMGSLWAGGFLNKLRVMLGVILGLQVVLVIVTALKFKKLQVADEVSQRRRNQKGSEEEKKPLLGRKA